MIDGNWVCYQFETIINNAAMDITAYAFLYTCVYISLGYICLTPIVSLYGIYIISTLVNNAKLFSKEEKFRCLSGSVM